MSALIAELMSESHILPPEIFYDPPLSLEEARFPQIIDNSQIADFTKCEQRWFDKDCRKLMLPDENVHLVAGGAYARGMEVTRKLFWDKGVDFHTALRAGMRAALLYYGTFEPHGRFTGKNIWRVLGAIEWHFSKWPIDSGITPFKPEGADKYAIEFSFAEPLPFSNPDTGEPLLYSGKCDMIGQDLERGILGPVDDKTTSALGDYWLSKWDLSSQMDGYCWAAKRNYPKYSDFIQCAFIRGVSILKTKYGQADARSYVDDEKLARWEKNLHRKIKRMIAAYERFKNGEEQPFERAWGDACSEFGGCAFKVLCESKDPEIWVPVNFTVNKWNPLESRD